MRTQIKNTVIILLAVLFANCSKDDDTPIDKGLTLFETTEEWNCNLSETCEDIYQFEFKEGTRISISIENITGKSVVSLDLSADFGEFGGPNLLTEGKLTYYGCTTQDESVSVTNVNISETGIYNLAVARDWSLSAGFDGAYKLTIISDTTFTEGETPTNDTEATNYERECI
ncbi:pre-peptidase C-terminal domain-containing protein [Flavivirga abyssicola]|uniref:pre-peptidase C-terminal domain-containing protein n=1 Tax=Flavivirga abyssicola TaxID=3063533 RepID=UPI0026E01E1D|nr:pre-peptidase C-terminal domain-containing protein [Flavivirga sp. MEBiC07777]WVK12242.1 pre-peptidase C-terminal domain-containing protein [Flavivirga sp. MEBiC07777]